MRRLIAVAAMLVFAAPIARADLWVRAWLVEEGTFNGWTMTKVAMAAHGHTFAGKPVLLGHEWGDPRACVGRIARVGLRQRAGKWGLEAILLLTHPDAEWRVKQRMYHSLSVGFGIRRYVCSVEGRAGCKRHRPGSTVITGKGPIKAVWSVQTFEGYEVSFVNVPAVRSARVLGWLPGPLALSPTPPKPLPKLPTPRKQPAKRD